MKTGAITTAEAAENPPALRVQPDPSRSGFVPVLVEDVGVAINPENAPLTPALNRRVLVIVGNQGVQEEFRLILTGEDDGRFQHETDNVAPFDGAHAQIVPAGFDVDFADDGETGLAWVRQAIANGSPYAVAIIDMRAAHGWSGGNTVEQLLQADPELQLIACTAFPDHAWEEIARRLGQNDRLLAIRKPLEGTEVRHLANALTAKWRLQRQARAQRDELEREAAERTASLTKAKQELEGKIKESLHAVEQAQAARATAEAIKQELVATNIVLNAEAERRLEREAELVKLTDTLQKEIAARQRAEQQFLQSQKMEAVGRLAGGVAHDFNNILTVIVCSSEILLSPGYNPNASRELIEQIKHAAHRAAALTRQLLAFSRQEIVTPVILNLNTVVTDAEKILRRVIKENIQFQLNLSRASRLIKADPGQIEQVLMNLVVNASDAMPDGGQLTIETSLVEAEPPQLPGIPDRKKGMFVLLTVSDTGCGMSEHTKARIFEPFFTTKERGKGTGLGLATVFGIVREAGGWLEVTSEVGKGSTFKVYLPQSRLDDAPSAASGDHEDTPTMQRSTETVLLVEDEDMVRDMLKMTLEAGGYTVLAAADGEEAIRRCQSHPGPIDILVTDLVMPGMSGRQVSERVRALRAGIPVLFISGYTNDEQVRHGVRESGQAFLQKPFPPSALSRKLRDVMGARHSERPAAIS